MWPWLLPLASSASLVAERGRLLASGFSSAVSTVSTIARNGFSNDTASNGSDADIIDLPRDGTASSGQQSVAGSSLISSSLTGLKSMVGLSKTTRANINFPDLPPEAKLEQPSLTYRQPSALTGLSKESLDTDFEGLRELENARAFVHDKRLLSGFNGDRNTLSRLFVYVGTESPIVLDSRLSETRSLESAQSRANNFATTRGASEEQAMVSRNTQADSGSRQHDTRCADDFLARRVETHIGEVFFQVQHLAYAQDFVDYMKALQRQMLRTELQTWWKLYGTFKRNYGTHLITRRDLGARIQSARNEEETTGVGMSNGSTADSSGQSLGLSHAVSASSDGRNAWETLDVQQHVATVQVGGGSTDFDTFATSTRTIKHIEPLGWQQENAVRLWKVFMSIEDRLSAMEPGREATALPVLFLLLWDMVLHETAGWLDLSEFLFTQDGLSDEFV